MYLYHVKRQQENLQNWLVFPHLPGGHRFTKEEFLREMRITTSVLRAIAILQRESPDEGHSASEPHSYTCHALRVLTQGSTSTAARGCHPVTARPHWGWPGLWKPTCPTSCALCGRPPGHGKGCEAASTGQVAGALGGRGHVWSQSPDILPPLSALAEATCPHCTSISSPTTRGYKEEVNCSIKRG